MANNNIRDKKNFVVRNRNGTIDKPWYIEFYVDGKRKQVKGNINQGKTIEERQRLAQLMIEELRQQYPPPARNNKTRVKLYQTLGLMAPEFTRKTANDYRQRLDHLFDYANRKRLTVDLLRKYFADYRADHAQTTTYNHRRKLNTIFRNAGYGHLLQSIKIKKGKHRPQRYFQPSQDAKIMNHLKQTDFKLYLYAGMVRFLAIRPRSEVRFLRVCDIFFEERKICLRADHTKSNENQFIRIPEHFYNDLFSIQDLPPNHFIFPSRKNKQVNPLAPTGFNTYSEKFKREINKFGFGEDYSIYSLKHTLAAAFIRAGGSVFQLMHHFRHKDIKTTQLYLRQLGLEVLDDFIDLIPPPGEWGKKNPRLLPGK